MVAGPVCRSLAAAAALVLGAGPFAGATSTLTVHNQTGKPLGVSQALGAWLCGPGAPLPDLAGDGRRPGPSPLAPECRCLVPGGSTTYRRLDPDQDLDVDLFIRRLPEDGLIQHEGLVIWAADPEPSCPPCSPSQPGS